MLETPETDYASERRVPRRTSAAPSRKLRRDFEDDFAEDFDNEGEGPGIRRRNQLRLSFRGGLPRTKWGRIGLGVGVLVALGAVAGAMMGVRSMVLHDDRFVIQSSSSIAVEGNQHLTKAQLLSIFGEDVERNVFTISLAERKADLERLPWVEHATVMRLLPDHIRVSVVERTPVAFVRQGSQIGLVDKSGVLLDMAGDPKAGTNYSFPVVTGIGAEDPLSTRTARMKIYERFTADLDAGGEKISQKLSEVDLSNPEDVKALIPDSGADILVHFGDTDYLDRYHKYEAHLAEWRAQYPKLSSVDMRYDRQVVLEMQPGSAVPLAGVASPEATAGATGAGAGGAKISAATKPAVTKTGAPKAAGHPAVGAKATPLAGLAGAGKAASPVVTKAPSVHPAAATAVAVKPKPSAKAKWVAKKVVAKKKAASRALAGKAQVSQQHPTHPPTVAH